MAEWRIEALWDRPAKYMAQPSTHQLLLRVTPGAPVGTAPVARPSVAANNEDGGHRGPPHQTEARPTKVPIIAVALDTSRSMSEHDSFAACVAAVMELIQRYGPTGAVQLACFSKAVQPVPPEQAASALAGLRLRSVSRYDLALDWLHATLAGPASAPADSADKMAGAEAGAIVPRIAVLLGDGGASDELGYATEPGPLLRRAQELAQAGVKLYTVGLAGSHELLAALAQAGAGVALHPAQLMDALAELAGVASSRTAEPAGPVPALAPAAAGRAGDELHLRLDSRMTGLSLLRTVRVRPAAACLHASGHSGGWQFAVGSLAPWETLELLLDFNLPIASFGTSEGPGPALQIALHDAAGQRLGECQTALDFSADPRRAQQLGVEVGAARRRWELAALDSWTSAQAGERARRQTGLLPPLPGVSSAGPVGGVPQ